MTEGRRSLLTCTTVLVLPADPKDKSCRKIHVKRNRASTLVRSLHLLSSTQVLVIREEHCHGTISFARGFQTR